MDILFSHVVHFLTGDFPFSSELQSFGMAYQGHVLVRNGRNKDLTMNWFHAFMLGVVSSFGGSAFAPLWMGRPSAILSNDIGLVCLISSFLLTYYTPFDIGYKFGNSFVGSLLCTSFATLFRTMGVVGYCSIAFEVFKASPSAYYPIPIVGPIVWATLLGNMSAFFVKGFDGHLSAGMPWNFQNGLFCASFFHFFVHDKTGPIGMALRGVVRLIPDVQMGLDDRTFCVVVISFFMQTMYILQMPELLGPSLSPFSAMQSLVGRILVTQPSVPKVEKPVVPNGGTKVQASNSQNKKNVAENNGVENNFVENTKMKKNKNKKKAKVQ